MASNVTDSSPAVNKQHKPKVFTEVVAEHEANLPIAVEVVHGGRYSGTKDCKNNNIELKTGDILWVTKASVTNVRITTESSKRKKSTAIIPADWAGEFKLPPSEYPVGHTFTTVAELAKDFPIFITVQKAFEIDGVTVEVGNRLKLLRHTTTHNSGKCLQCNVIDTGKNVILPETMEGTFEKTEKSTRFKVQDLTDRLPLHALPVFSGNMNKTDSIVPGLPEDYDEDLLLTEVNYTEVLPWETSNRDKTNVWKIPDATKMEVVVLEKWAEDKGPSVDIVELAKVSKKDIPVFAVPAENSDTILNELGVAKDSTLLIHPVDTVERILVQGLNSPLLVSKRYQGYFKPQTKYGTGHDLVSSGIQREVKVTQLYRPNEDESGLDPLYVNDMVKLHLSKPKRFSTGEDTDIEVLELERTASNNGKLGAIYVPANALVGYEERIQYSVDQKLVQLAQCQVPIGASFSSSPNSSMTTADNTPMVEDILKQQSPMLVLGLLQYSAALVTVFNQENPKESKVVEISEHAQLKVRRVRRPPLNSLPDKLESDRTIADVQTISKKYFNKLNQAMEQLYAAKTVKRRGEKKKNQENDTKRKSWIQRNITFKAVQQRFLRNRDDAGDPGNEGQDWSLSI